MVWGIPLCLPQNNSICPDLSPFDSAKPCSWVNGRRVPRAGSDGQLAWGTSVEQCSLISKYSTDHLGHQGREGFPFFVLPTEKGKQMPFLLPQHPYQGPLQMSHWYRWLQESSVLLLMATTTALPSTRHGWLYTNPWKQKPHTNYTAARAGTNAQASTSAWEFRWNRKLKFFSTSSQVILGRGTEYPVAALFQSEVIFSFSL